jgi:hypothetical protein
LSTEPANKRLIVTFTVDADRDASLNAWYNLEHIAPRMGMPEGRGFQTCNRFFVSNGASRYLNVYDLDDEGLDSTEYTQIRDSEAKMPVVAYQTGHFKNDYPDQFRRLVVNHAEQLAGERGNHGSADAVVLDVVRGSKFEDLPVWTRTTFKATLAASDIVTSSAIWNLEGDDGYVVITDVDLHGVYDWNRVYGGTLAWLPEHARAGLESETLVGHSIARFARAVTS